MERILIAIGGNALYDKAGGNNLHPDRLTTICQTLVEVVTMGYLPLVTFGNGPQVGQLLDMAETAATVHSAPVTLDTCVSWTQGEIGYRLCRQLQQALLHYHLSLPVVTLNTMVVVDPNDQAFQRPTKPIGHFISVEMTERIYEERGWIIGPDANRGYRRLVPSPKPQEVIEIEAIRALVQSGSIVLCGGGGGIPVYWEEGMLHGIEAVIDKDFTSCLLAKELEISTVVICTDVDQIYLHYGTPDQKALGRVASDRVQQYLEAGQFAEGSMGPKVAALLNYLNHGGHRAVITSLGQLTEALKQEAGTEIYRNTSSSRVSS